jgi:UV DNA damage endonuclease
MRIRLGYVAIALTLEKITSSSLLTYTHFKKIGDEVGYSKLHKIIISNFNDLEKILNYNIKNNIHFYRLTSKLIPLATHKDVSFDYAAMYQENLKMIGLLINKAKMRVDVHPDQYCVINSIREDVVQSSMDILKFQQEILELMNIKNPKIILHIGSGTGGKIKSVNRFINTYNNLNPELKKMIIIENDDKTFNVRNTLSLCEKLDIPMVLDYHHHLCNNNGEKIEDFIERIFATWSKEDINPKVHFSSPRSKKEFLAHSDYIDSDEFIKFIEKIKFIDKDLDVMLEVKMKDMALFKLIRELKYKTDYKFVDDTTFIV